MVDPRPNAGPPNPPLTDERLRQLAYDPIVASNANETWMAIELLELRQQVATLLRMANRDSELLGRIVMAMGGDPLDVGMWPAVVDDAVAALATETADVEVRAQVEELEARPDRAPGQSTAVVLLPDGNIAYDMGIWWREIGPGGADFGNIPGALPKGSILLLPLEGPYVVDPRLNRYREALEQLAQHGCIGGHDHGHCWDCYKHAQDWCFPCIAQYALDPWTGREQS
ncbi:hypothetical protein [Nocardia wallacei]|uniref:hypothetical protein n=1 Tax=Nocardia wallacei TaxID=480035 RepID=UPI0024542BFA|nr:hypothetical protein [Nocardia wallacei]